MFRYYGQTLHIIYIRLLRFWQFIACILQQMQLDQGSCLSYNQPHVAFTNICSSMMIFLSHMPLLQVLSLLPVYLLQLCYGMNSGFPAILTPQLAEPCSEFQISLDQESWIGWHSRQTLRL